MDTQNKYWMPDYLEVHAKYEEDMSLSMLSTQTATQSSNTLFPSLMFPIVRSVQASLLGGDPKLLEAAKNKVTAVNRERQIEDILDNKEYIPLDIKETEEYKEYQASGLISVVPMSGLTGALLYMDFMYEKQKPKKRKFRRPGYYGKQKRAK